jgi:hypothetical protein
VAVPFLLPRVETRPRRGVSGPRIDRRKSARLLVCTLDGSDSFPWFSLAPVAGTAVGKFDVMRKSMPGDELLPPSSLLTLTTLERNDAGWTVKAEGLDHADCPRCPQVSTARHRATCAR